MRRTLLIMLMGLLIVTACVPAVDVPSATDTPIPVTTEPPSEMDDPAATATATEVVPPPAGPDGQALMQDRCTECHSLSRVERASNNAEEWRGIVDRMVGYGAVLSAAELDVLVLYLAETYP